VQIVYPAHEFRNLYGRDVEIDNEALLPASCQHAVKQSIFARVDLLMRDVGRDVDEIPAAASATNSRRSPNACGQGR